MKKTIVLLLIIFLFSGFFSFASGSQEFDDFIVAKEVFRDGFYDLAKVKLIKYLNDYPDSERRAQVFLLLGQSYKNTGDLHKAVLYINRALDARGADIIKDVIYFWLAELNVQAQQFKQAKHYYKEVFDNYPESEYASKSHQGLARIYFMQGDYKTALNHYEKILSLYKKEIVYSEIAFKKAICLFRLREFQNSFDLLGKILEDTQDKKNPLIFYYMAENLYNLKNYQEAIKWYKDTYYNVDDEYIKKLSLFGMGWCYLETSDYKSSIEKFKHIYDYYEQFEKIDAVCYGLAKSFFKLGHYEQALEYYKEIIDFHKDSDWLDEAYLDTVGIFFDLQKYNQALKISEQALGDIKDSYLRNEILYNQGWIYIRLNELEKAIENFEDVMITRNDDLKIRSICRLGDIYFDMQEYGKAMDYYDIILDEYPNSFYSYYAQYWLGVCLYKLDNFQGAAISFRTFLNNYPNNYLKEEVRFYLAQSLFNDEKYMEAAEHFSILAKNTDNKRFQNRSYLLWGSSLFNEGKYLKALEIFKNIKDGEFSQEIKERAFYQIAWCYYQLGQEQRTIDILEKFAEKYPKSNYIPDILFWLGDYFYSKSEFKKAIESYKKFIDRFSEHVNIADAYYWMAWSFFKIGELEESLNYFKSVLNYSEKKSLLYDSKINIAKIYYRKDKDERSILILKELIKEAKDTYYYYLSKRTLADIYLDLNYLEKAISMYSEALRRGDEYDNWNGYIQFHIALGYERKEEYEEAISEYLKASYLYSRSPFWNMQSKLSAAKLLEKTGKLEDALKLYEDLVEEDSDAAMYARDRIRIIRVKMMRQR